MMFYRRARWLASLPCAILLSGLAPSSLLAEKAENRDWPVYLGDSASSQYSSIDHITKENVHKLKVAWTFDGATDSNPPGTMIECNPLVIDGVLYGTGSNLVVRALDAATGALRWEFDQLSYLSSLGIESSRGGNNRGLAYWTDGVSARVLFGVRQFLFALDARTGVPIKSFGEAGKIDLKEGLGRDISELSYRSSSPGIVFDDLIIMGSSVSETPPAAPGHIRAFDVRTGKQVWRFNTIPHPGEFGYDTWPEDAYKTIGGANVWTGMALDEERGLIYCPTGSAVFDFYGADRHGQNLFANTLLCLDARTGEREWHYQIVHHDLWDYDLPTPPNLLTVSRDGREIPAVAQLTKQGFAFVFNRVTGEPLFPIEEKPVPPSHMPGEKAWPTQPRPTQPAPYVREVFSLEDVTDVSEESHAEIVFVFKSLPPHQPFLPPSHESKTIQHPGMIGGAEWGGAATDPNGILYFNANVSTALISMVDLGESKSEAQAIFNQSCAVCHGVDLKGGDAFGQVVPTLEGVASRLGTQDIMEVILEGRGIMPPHAHLGKETALKLAHYLENPDELGADSAAAANGLTYPLRYRHTGNNRWKDSRGYPAIKPPWGTLNAIDLNTGKYLWRVPFGEFPELLERGLPVTGRENFGGPVVTASGLLFIAASLDGYIRAYDADTGEELWRDQLPAGGYATPATYSVDGKQYIVIACGGGRNQTEADKYVAYALP